MSLQSPANIAGTFNQTSYNGGSSSGSIIYHSTHVDGSAPASGRYYYRVFVTYDPGTEDNWIYFNTSDNKWYDHGQHDPVQFTVNGSSPAGPSPACSGGETVALIDSNGGTVFTFTHPTWLVGSTPTAFDNTNGQPNLGPITGGMYPSQFNGDTFYLVSSASSSTKLVYNAWSGASDGAEGMEFTFNSGSGGTYVIHVNAGNDSTYNPDSVSVAGSTAGNTAVCSVGDTVTIYDSNGYYGTFTVPTFNTGSGSGSGSGGGINTLSGGSSPEIKDITFTKASDTIVYLAFNWQNVSTAYLFVDSGGTVSQTNISLGGLGQSGSVGSSGFLTNMQDGDKVWIANTDTVDAPYIHRYIDWSYDKATGKVSAEAFFKDLGGNGFNQNADFALARVFGQTYSHGYSLAAAQADPTGGHVNHDGTLQSLTLSAEPGSRWAVTGLDTLQYGIGFKVPKKSTKVSSNFW